MAADHQNWSELPETKYMKVSYSEFGESSFLCGSSLCICGSLYQYVLQDGREVIIHPDIRHLRLNLSLHSTAQHSMQYNVKWWFGNSVQDCAHVICRSHRI